MLQDLKCWRSKRTVEEAQLKAATKQKVMAMRNHEDLPGFVFVLLLEPKPPEPKMLPPELLLLLLLPKPLPPKPKDIFGFWTA